MTPALVLVTPFFLSAAPGLQPVHRPYDVQHYKLEVKQGDAHAFENTLTATVRPTRPLSEVEFDAYNLKIATVKIDGQPATYSELYEPKHQTGRLKIKAPRALTSGKNAEIEIAYSVVAGISNQGFFVATDLDRPDSLPGYFTHFEPNYAQRFMPLNDTPLDKATSEVLATVDARYQVVSNGRKEKDERFSEGGKNLRRVHWKQEQPHSPYLIALAIAELEPIVVSEDIPSTLWVPPGTADRAFIAADALKDLFRYQVGFTGTKFPFSKLDVVAVPHFFSSGMENTSVIFERTSRLLVDHRNDQTSRTEIVSLLSHEMAHQYFGDWVTCRWWNDIWLNEGFASYLGSATTDNYNGTDEVEISIARNLVHRYFAEEDGPRSHPLQVKGIPAEEAFDGTSYVKGASVLRMLELWVGKSEMKKALKHYLEKHAAQNATSQDFFQAVFESTKKEKELKPFRDSWLNQKGYPVLYPDANYAGGKLTITLRQQPNHAGQKGAFTFKLPIVIQRVNEPAYVREELLTIDKPEVKVVLDVPAAPEWINWNKNFGALAKINPSAVSESQWVDAARHDRDPVWRLLATWQLLGELGNPHLKAETKPTDAAMGAILDVLTQDASPYVREAVLEQLAQTRFKRLPSEFAAPLLSLARRPENLEEDPAGYIRVRVAAMEALGRVDAPEAHRWLLEELGKKDIDLNYLPGYAAAAARIGTPAALGQLRAALVTQQGRGFGYYQRAAVAPSKSNSLEALTIVRSVLQAYPGNNELARAVVRGYRSNAEVRESREFAHFVRDIVLDEKIATTEFRTELLGALDDVKYESAKEALQVISQKSAHDRIKARALQVLAANFPKR